MQTSLRLILPTDDLPPEFWAAVHSDADARADAYLASIVGDESRWEDAEGDAE